MTASIASQQLTIISITLFLRFVNQYADRDHVCRRQQRPRPERHASLTAKPSQNHQVQEQHKGNPVSRNILYFSRCFFTSNLDESLY